MTTGMPASPIPTPLTMVVVDVFVGPIVALLDHWKIDFCFRWKDCHRSSVMVKVGRVGEMRDGYSRLAFVLSC